MTPNWLPQQPWLNVTPQPQQGGGGLAQGLGQLGTALVNYKRDPKVPAANLQVDAVPAPADPAPLPAVMPSYGTPPVAGAQNPMQQNKGNILASMLGNRPLY